MSRKTDPKKQSMKKKQKRQLEQNKRSLFLEQRSIVRIVLGTKSLVLGLGWRLGLQFSLGLGLLGLQLGKLGVKGLELGPFHAVKCKENALGKVKNGLKNAFGPSTAYDVASHFRAIRRPSQRRFFPFFAFLKQIWDF